MTKPTRLALLALALAAACARAPVAAAGPPVVGGQFRYWAFSNHNDLRDVLAYWAPGPFHVQLEYWDFVDDQTKDRFRPEVGIHLRDARRSVYTLQYRHEGEQERFWAMTDQVIGDRLVGRLEVSPIVPHEGNTQVVLGAGLDVYWRSYDFAQVTVYRDPRAGGLWVVPMRVRFANEANDWFQVTVAPASRRTVGWAVDGKWRWLRAGVERNNRYDFTTLDNVITTIGFERRLGPAE